MTDITFDVHFSDGRVAECWQGAKQEYQDCTISAGLVTGIEPDSLYFRFERDDDDGPTTFFLRPDEMLALIHVCSGAMWSDNILAFEVALESERTADQNTKESENVD